jgi:hypothetical protein
VRFLRRSAPDPAGSAGAEGPESTASPGTVEAAQDGAQTRSTGKGRPTPKRREAEARRRGPAPPPPRTQREASRLARANRPSKDERRRAAAERRERMAAGDQRYLMPRDRGPVRAYVRDLVDSRPHLMGLFMPLAGVVFLSVLLPIPEVQRYLSLFSMVALVTMIVEGVVVGLSIVRKARAKFPDEIIPTPGTMWYVFTRASQPRKLRVPKPRVARGANP